jgi:hypothetical protein
MLPLANWPYLVGGVCDVMDKVCGTYAESAAAANSAPIEARAADLKLHPCGLCARVD